MIKSKHPWRQRATLSRDPAWQHVSVPPPLEVAGEREIREIARSLPAYETEVTEGLRVSEY